LNGGGRLEVACHADTSFDKRRRRESDDAANFHLRAEIKLPGSTFSRAGTGEGVLQVASCRLQVVPGAASTKNLQPSTFNQQPE
jgi:hypothetical protein